ncbi:MAG: hypothetical protein OHK0050_22740 [Roseiflexaceae bacterium]
MKRFLAALGMTVGEGFLAALGMTVGEGFLAALGMTGEYVIVRERATYSSFRGSVRPRNLLEVGRDSALRSA